MLFYHKKFPNVIIQSSSLWPHLSILTFNVVFRHGRKKNGKNIGRFKKNLMRRHKATADYRQGSLAKIIPTEMC